MKTDVKCNYCEEDLGTMHGNKQSSAHTKHFREKHLKEYTEIKNAEIAYLHIRKHYNYRGF